jgi:hypothetical protein
MFGVFDFRYVCLLAYMRNKGSSWGLGILTWWWLCTSIEGTGNEKSMPVTPFASTPLSLRLP